MARRASLVGQHHAQHFGIAASELPSLAEILRGVYAWAFGAQHAGPYKSWEETQLGQDFL
jgi:hypothetical protein